MAQFVQIGRMAFNPARFEDTVWFGEVDHYEPDGKGGLRKVGKAPGVTLCHGDQDEAKFIGKDLETFMYWWENEAEVYVVKSISRHRPSNEHIKKGDNDE